jgi:hypothetical protein
MEQDDVTVTTIQDRPRNLGDYKSTNMPLSKSEIKNDEDRDTEHQGWAPRTLENIGDMRPLPEKPRQP